MFLGPHSIRSLKTRIGRFQKVALGNAIHNSQVILGKDLRKIIKIKITKKDILLVLNMLKKRQDSAMRVLNSDPGLALHISIKNLVKIAMASLEYKNIFENSSEKAGKLFKKEFNLPRNELPAKACRFKLNKEKILKNKNKVEQIVNQTYELLQSTIKLFRR